MNWESAVIFLDGIIEKLRARSNKVSEFWLKAIGKRLRELKGLDPSAAAGIVAIRNDTKLLSDLMDDMKAKAQAVQEFDGKQMTVYEATQAQRRLEREIRKQKNRAIIAKAAGEDDMRRIAQTRINYLTDKYKELSDTFNIPTKMERTSVSGFRPMKIAANALPKAKNTLPSMTIPERVTHIDITNNSPQNVGNMPDMRNLYDPNDQGRECAVSLPVIYDRHAVEHLLKDHPERLEWLHENEQDIIKAIEHPEFIEKTLRHLDNGYFSATHIIKVSHSTKKSDEYMFIGISLSNNPNGDGSYHQITTIHPARRNRFMTADGKPKEKFKKA